MSNELEGKIAVVTGAASGIGLASAEAMMTAGATVVMVDRDEKALSDLAEKFGDTAIMQVTDLLDAESCAALIPEVLEKTGRIDILHCNAGTYIGGDLVDTDAATIDRMLNLNVNAVIKNVHAVIPHMIAQGGGDIVVTSSLAGRSAIKHEPVYSASKWAVTCFTQTTRRQVNKHGIRVAQVSPGPVISALLADWPADRLEDAKQAGALIEPKEVAEAVLFILSRPRNVTIHDVVVLPTNVDA
ncbi:SDR family oxidoreductase [Tropicimonas isoalkanivorans]|uniref:Ribitol 2-dehydrogenase n=1 Tax=Tropicimonas isoalkanivorans TaxID=441112 RepID=A0A1I1M440_9RHOB|nr:SDR family oxidoreductase [Tropicimonas isoalkanivorans]SFC79985.1 ribitol 2-dehydrogenase [Tropicimonas isoalkanivorans]